MAVGDYLLAAAAWLGIHRASPKAAKVAAHAAATLAILRAAHKAWLAVQRRRVKSAAAISGFRVAIVGSGFGGVCAAIKLQELGIPYTIFERSKQGIGGTWRENTYPGCGCDVMSVLYSFSFARNPDWSKGWSDQSEILRYIVDLADRFGVRGHVQLGREVLRSKYVEAERRWDVTVRDTETGATSTLPFSAVITAVGQLGTQKTATIPGLERFRGRTMHTAHWDSGVDFTGKRVACIGTGPSAVQAVPELAKVAGTLDVYQRSPSWVLPKPNVKYSETWKFLNRHFDCLNLAQRWYRYLYMEMWFFGSFDNKDRLKAREQTRKDVLEGMRKMCGGDEALLAKLTPDFPLGCKRVLISDDWIPTFRRDNCNLITDAVVSATETGLVAADGSKRDYDILVWATGFDSQNFLLPMEVFGRDGVNLQEKWTSPTGAKVPKAYFGMTVPDFPNFFILYGPSTNLGSNSILFMLECQCNHICQVLQAVLLSGKRACEVGSNVASAYFTEYAERTKNVVFGGSDCASWYKNADGQLVNNWIGSTIEYWWRTRSTAPSSYALL